MHPYRIRLGLLIPLAWFFIFSCNPLFAQPASKKEGAMNTIRVHAILQKHCASCHATGNSRNLITLLDHPKIVAESRKPRPMFIDRKNPAASQLLELVQDGSMPPGNLPKLAPEEIKVLQDWVKDGANAYPEQFDQSFVLKTILEDISSVDLADRKFYRYFSLHHLADNPPELQTKRGAFLQTVISFGKSGIPQVRPVDATETIYRVDLRQLGWEIEPFQSLSNAGESSPVSLNIFDTLLLEYPYGIWSPAQLVHGSLTEQFLRAAGQVRPIAFVRADWFVDAVNGTRLKNDLERLKNPLARPLTKANLPKGVFPKLDANPAFTPDEKSFAIPAIDSTYGPDYAPDNAPKVKINVLDELGLAKNVFQTGESFKLELISDVDVFMEIIWYDGDNDLIVFHGLQEVKGGTPKLVSIRNKGIPIGDVVGTMRFMIFASTEKFPLGTKIESRHQDSPVQRFVHSYFELPKEKVALKLPPKMVRKSFLVEVKEAKK